LNLSEVEQFAFMRKHAGNLVTPSEIARRTGRRPSTISDWQYKDNGISDVALIADLGAGNLFWWPAVRDWLDERGIAYAERAVKQAVLHLCAHCGSDIRPGELERRAELEPGRRFYHFNQADCAAALRRQGASITSNERYRAVERQA
jgi:hypothetical protein